MAKRATGIDKKKTAHSKKTEKRRAKKRVMLEERAQKRGHTGKRK
ncbi:MAG: hypothetical protein WD003_01005 [Candidatus Paceibacterota bacterium]